MNALVGVRGIRVASRTSAFRAQKDGGDLSAIARALSVGHVLEGSVRTSGSRLRVTAQLTDVASGYPALVGAIRSGGRGHLRRPGRDRRGRRRRGEGPSRSGRARGSGPAAGREPRGLPQLPEGSAPSRGRRTTPGPFAPSRRPSASIRLMRRRGPASRRSPCSRVRLRRDPRARGLRHGEKGAGDRGTTAGRVGRRPPCRGLRGLDRTTMGRDGGRLAPGDRAPAHPRPGPGLVRASSCAHARGSTRRCRSSSAPGRPIRSRPFPTPSPGGACSYCGRPQEALRYLEDALSFEKEDATALCAASSRTSPWGDSRKASRRPSGCRDIAPRGPLPRHAGVGTRDRGPDRRGADDPRGAASTPGGSPTVVSEAWLLGALGEIDAAFDVLARAEEECQGHLYFTGLPGFDPLRSDPRFTALLERLGLSSA